MEISPFLCHQKIPKKKATTKNSNQSKMGQIGQKVAKWAKFATWPETVRTKNDEINVQNGIKVVKCSLKLAKSNQSSGRRFVVINFFWLLRNYLHSSIFTAGLSIGMHYHPSLTGGGKITRHS